MQAQKNQKRPRRYSGTSKRTQDRLKKARKASEAKGFLPLAEYMARMKGKADRTARIHAMAKAIGIPSREAIRTGNLLRQEEEESTSDEEAAASRGCPSTSAMWPVIPQSTQDACVAINMALLGDSRNAAAPYAVRQALPCGSTVVGQRADARCVCSH
jgi:hypothetical protein